MGLPAAKEARQTQEGEKAKKVLSVGQAGQPTTKPIVAIGMPQPAPAPRQLVWYLLKDPQTMTLAEQEVLPKLKAACSELALTYELVQEFIKMVKHRKPEALEPWLSSVASSKLRDLENFALGIERDKAAVLAALSSEWSNGQTEDQVNRLKLLKRQMYGRAKFDLLRKRVLHRASSQPHPIHQM